MASASSRITSLKPFLGKTDGTIQRFLQSHFNFQTQIHIFAFVLSGRFIRVHFSQNYDQSGLGPSLLQPLFHTVSCHRHLSSCLSFHPFFLDPILVIHPDQNSFLCIFKLVHLGLGCFIRPQLTNKMKLVLLPRICSYRLRFIFYFNICILTFFFFLPPTLYFSCFSWMLLAQSFF